MRVRLLEDDFDILFLVMSSLEKEGHVVDGYYSVDEAREADDWDTIDVALMDWSMPNNNGGVLASWLKEEHPTIRRVLMTALPDAVPIETELFDLVLRKPFSPRSLREAVQWP